MSRSAAELLAAAFPDGQKPSGDQTAEQAEAFAIVGVRHICAFEGGLAVATEAEIRAALAQPRPLPGGASPGQTQAASKASTNPALSANPRSAHEWLRKVAARSRSCRTPTDARK